MVIAIDGHSSCGKSSFAKQIAAKLGFLYIDSGAMYRAVTLFGIEKKLFRGKSPDVKKFIKSLDKIDITFGKSQAAVERDVFLNGENVSEKIRSMEVSSRVSEVSKIKQVREKMVTIQRSYSRQHDVVMDGRDIGTVVFPGAELKIFMTASLDVRAERRYLELREKGLEISISEVRENLAERDRIDQGREFSPLKKAADAVLLDNSGMNPEEQMTWFNNLLEERKSGNIH